MNFLMSLVPFRMSAAWNRWLFVASVICTTFTSFSSMAAPLAADVKKAAEAFDRGREAFRAESYVEAAEHFEAADAYASSAASLRLAIAARKEAGQLDRALSLAALALTTYPDDQTVITEAQAVIDEHQAEFGRIEVTCDDPCELLLDGKLVHGPPALSHTVYVSPGSYQVQASWSEDRTDEETVTAVAADRVAVDLTAPPLEVAEVPPPPPPAEPAADEQPEEKRNGWAPAIFWTGLGATLVGVGVTTGLGINATNNPGTQAVLQGCAPRDQTCDLYQQGVANQTAANVAAGVTVGLGVFTIIAAIATDWGGKKGKKAEPDPSSGWSVRSGDFTLHPTMRLGSDFALGAAGTF